uniref:Merozoite surface protein 5 n=1 Tax=Babesia rodhaini TaxID=5870 RepID=A0A2Z6E9G7_BABRO|nr:merozoite surface protein 5 [Babesia rodhaini]
MAALKLTLFAFLAVAFTYNPVFCENLPNITDAPIKPTKDYKAKKFKESVDKTDAEIIKLVLNGFELLPHSMHDLFKTYMNAFSTKNDSAFINSTKADEKTHKEALIKSLKNLNTFEESVSRLDKIIRLFRVYGDFLNSVYYKARSKGNQEATKKMVNNVYWSKALIIKKILFVYNNVASLSITEIEQSGAVNPAYVIVINDSKVKFAALREEADKLVSTIGNNKDKAEEYYIELLYAVKQIFELTKKIHKQAINNRNEKQVEYQKSFQYKLYDLIGEMYNVSRSVIPGFFAIALSFFMIVL